MPTPETQTPKPVRVKPDEAGASGGAPAEGELPQEFEIVSVDKYGVRRVKRVWNISYKQALKSVASELFHEIADEVAPDLLSELPYPRFTARIYGAKTGDVYKVEVKMRHFTRVIHLKKHRADYYFGGINVLSVGGYPIYIRAEAVYSIRGRITFYEIIEDRTAIETLEEEIHKMLEGEQ
jgi:hypothetical protein